MKESKKRRITQLLWGTEHVTFQAVVDRFVFIFALYMKAIFALGVAFAVYYVATDVFFPDQLHALHRLP